MERRESFLLTVYIPGALLSLGEGFVIPVLPLFASTMNVSFALVSVAVAATSLAQLFVDIPLGMATDILGRRRVMIMGPCLVMVSSLATFFAGSIIELIVYRLLFGVGTAMWSISRHVSLAVMVAPAERGKAMSIFGGVQRFGTLVGPAISGFLAAIYGLSFPFVVVSVLSAGALLIVVFTVKSSGGKIEQANTNASRLIATLKSDSKRFGVASSALFFTMLARRGRLILLPLFGAFQIHLGVEQIGLVLAASAVADLVMFAPAGYVMDKWGRRWAIVPAFAVMGIGIGLIPFCDSFAALLSVALVIGVGNGLSAGSMDTLGADLAPSEVRGAFLGLWRAVADFGSFVGPVTVGLLSDGFGIPASALVIASFSLASSTTVGLFLKETLKKS